jgi:hypothetical protein
MDNGKLRMKENPYPGNAEAYHGFNRKREDAELGLGDPRRELLTERSILV